MRSLDPHLQMTSHFLMCHRVEETLIREGLVASDSSGADIRQALERWVTMAEEAGKIRDPRLR